MQPPDAADDLPRRARELRRQGLSTRQIAEQLGVPLNGSVKRWVLGVPPPAWTGRPGAKDAVRAEAEAMRREGRTYDDIAAALGISKSTCSLWLRDLPRPVPRRGEHVQEPPPDELQRLAILLRRAGASRSQMRAAFGDLPVDLRALLTSDAEVSAAPPDPRSAARWLRSRGWSLAQIARALGTSTSTASEWCRGVGPQLTGSAASPSGASATRDATRRRRETGRQNDKLAAARLLGDPDTRDLVVAAVTAYWCEGSKDKPYARRETLAFINSDPGLIRLWSRFLDLLEVPSERRRFRVHIHETADVAAAEDYWALVVGAPVSQFSRAVIKRHRPRTNRLRLGEGYHGCLVITVLQGARLYRVVEGAFYALSRDVSVAAV